MSESAHWSTTLIDHKTTSRRRRSSRLMRLNHLCSTSTHNQMTKRLSNGVTIPPGRGMSHSHCHVMSPCASHKTTNSQRDLFRASSFNCEFGSVSINFRISTCSLKRAETAENSRNRFIIKYHLHHSLQTAFMGCSSSSSSSSSESNFIYKAILRGVKET